MANQSLYTVGGTIQPGEALYIARQADEDLVKLCRQGTFGYILAARQVGKSSLMVRTARRLAEEGIRAIIIDLTKLGVQVTAESWYLGLLYELQRRLLPNFDVVEWWRSRAHLGPAQALTLFFQEVLLARVAEPVVIFVDEIDSTLSLDFTDDFYAAIRYLYNARAELAEFRWLSFVLIGVATPGDLIRDPKRTPFNIGQRVELTDFTPEEALPFANGLSLPPVQARQVLGWVMKWTGGHPYLTQRMCRALAEELRRDWTEAEVDQAVFRAFFGRMSEEDNNLQFVRDMLTKRAPDKLRVLEAYKEIRLGRRPVRDEEQSPVKVHLKLSGVVKRENGRLMVRNQIYHEVFDSDWVKAHWPANWLETIPPSVKVTGGVIVVLTLVLFFLTLHAFRLAVDNEKIAKRERVARDSLQIALNEQVRLTYVADSAKHEASRSASDAIIEEEKATRAAQNERQVRLEADAQRQRAEGESRRANLREAEADFNRRVALTSLEEVERRRRIEIARVLAIQAPHVQPSGNNELSVLLARQAFFFNKRNDGRFENEIYQALLKTLNGAGGPRTLRGHEDEVRTVAFHPRGDLVASGSGDGIVRLWDLSQPNTIVLRGHKTSVRSLAFSSDGNILASASDDHTVHLWNLQAGGAELKTLLHPKEVRAVAFSPDGKQLASGGADSTVRLWALQGLNAGPTRVLPHESKVVCVSWNSDGSNLATGCDDGSVNLWDIRRTGAKPITMQGRSTRRVNTVAFSADDKTLASGSDDWSVRVWNLNDPLDSPQLLRGHQADVNAVEFSPDGQTLASASNDGKVLIWQWQERSESPILEFDHDSWVWSIAFSPDGETLATGSRDRVVRLWQTHTQALAEKVCATVSRNLTPQEWQNFVGLDIPYEQTCANPSLGDAAQSERSSSKR